MMESSNFHILLYDGLRMLGFERYLKSNKFYNDLEFNHTTFLKANQKAFEVVTYFLFSQLKGPDYVRPFRGCYPCLDKTHESDFRKGAISLFKKLEADGSNFNYKFLPGIICNPGGDSFVTLYVAFLNYILKKQMNVDKTNEHSTDDLLVLIDQEKSLLMNNCNKLKEKTANDEEHCAYFDGVFNSVENDEKALHEKVKQVDQELLSRFNTNDIDELKSDLIDNFKKIKSHKLRTLYKENKEVLKTEISDIENRVISLEELVNDSTLLPVDLVEVQRLFEDKLNGLKQKMDKDNTNIEEAIEKLDLKSVYYTSTNRILNDLTNSLEKKINVLKQRTEEKKLVFLKREDVQNLVGYIKSRINFKPPTFDFKPEKKERKQSPDLNLTQMDQTLLGNKSTEEEFNLSINLAEMTCDYLSNENINDESYMLSQCLNRTQLGKVSNVGGLGVNRFYR